MKIYIVNGVKRRYADGEAPEGAILCTKVKPIQAEPEKKEEPKEEKPAKTKARKTQNKSRKAESNK